MSSTECAFFFLKKEGLFTSTEHFRTSYPETERKFGITVTLLRFLKSFHVCSRDKEDLTVKQVADLQMQLVPAAPFIPAATTPLLPSAENLLRQVWELLSKMMFNSFKISNF